MAKTSNADTKFLSTLSLRRATTGIFLNLTSHKHFYPRSPCGERPYLEENQSEPENISIHALLAESDGPIIIRVCYYTYFYPRSPCGERLARSCARFSRCLFLSTLSLRRATGHAELMGCAPRISIHALLAESDSRLLKRCQSMLSFLSTLSLRRATAPNRRPCPRSKISIHALLAESDYMCPIISTIILIISIHALLAESDPEYFFA